MVMTMSLLYEKLAADHHCKKNKSRFSDCELSAPMLYTGGALSTEYVYVIVGSEKLERDLTGMSLISLGAPAFDLRSCPVDLLIVEEEGLELTALFNRVQSLFLELTQWDLTMERLAYEEVDLRKLLLEARRELPFSLIYLNKYYNPNLAVDNDSQISIEVLGAAEEGEPVFSQLPASMLTDAGRMDAPKSFALTDSRLSGLYFNLFYHTDYRGKLLALTARPGPVSHGCELLFLAVCRNVERFYKRFSASNIRTPSYRMMQGALRSLFSADGQYSKMEILKAVRSTQWSLRDQFSVYFLPFDEQGSILANADYLITLIENHYINLAERCCRGVVLDNGLVWVTNETRLKESDQSGVMDSLKQLLKTYQSVVGISVVCEDFFQIHTYFQQANHAIRLGKQKEVDTYFYRFADYSLDYMLESAPGGFDMRDVIHPSLLLLKKVDEENHSELFKTLRVYIKCQYNVSQASNALYIHRSTFSFRLERIESLCGLDLNDERCRLHLLLSFHILESHTDLFPTRRGDR